MIRIEVKPDDSLDRLDAWLAWKMPERSRSAWQKLIKTGAVSVNGKASKANYAVEPGDVIEIAERAEIEEAGSAAPEPKIVDETEEFAVIEKPPGLLVHPAPNQKKATLADFILKRWPSAKGVGEAPERPGIVHRLDREASGLMVIAKTQASFENLKRQFQEHKTAKEYFALVYGKVSKDVGAIETSIGRKKGMGRMSARAKPLEGDREARSAYEVLERFPHATLVKVRTETGRMHQVRVHLKSIGHPLVGDELYASATLRNSPSLRTPRLFLHAAALAFDDLAGKRHEYRSELPKDLYDFLQGLRAKHHRHPGRAGGQR